MRPTQERLDIREYGAPQDGNSQTSEKRLYLQLHVFDGVKDPRLLTKPLADSGLESVLYLDLNNPYGVGLLVLSEDPDVFVSQLRCLLQSELFQNVKYKPEWTMIGRTYSSGREPNLEDWLLAKPRRSVFNPTWSWAVWYPLRRKSEFALLSKEDQGKILYEHAMMGRKYGESGYAADVRLACHGLDAHDNDFVIGLIGPDLHPLSRLVQDMRKSQQTAKYVQSLGPFFVGKALWKSQK